MKVLITGIAGQLGNRLSQILYERNISHKGICRNIKYKPLPGVECVCVSLSDITHTTLKAFMIDVTHVVHFADVITDSTDYENDLMKQFQNCCINTIKLINCLPKTIEHFIFGSSVAVYGSPKQLPITESTTPCPQNIYGYTKLATEIYIKSNKFKFPIAILRIGSIYGPGPKNINQYRAVPNIINTVLQGKSPYVVADGSTFRDYMYIDDCLNACVNTMIINISEKDLTLEHDYDKQVEWSAVCNVSKMENKLNYSPIFSTRTGLYLTYKWHQKFVNLK